MANKKDLKGLANLIDRMRKVQEAVKHYADRHEQLLADMKADSKFDPLECLPGLMGCQQTLDEAVREYRLSWNRERTRS